MNPLKTLKLLVLLLVLLLGACSKEPIFKPIPLDRNPPILAQPIFFAIDEARARGYLINSNNTVLYENASLLVFDLTNPIAPTLIKGTHLRNFSGQAWLDGAGQKLYLTNRLNDNKVDENDRLLRINLDEASGDFLKIEEFITDSNPFGILSDNQSLYVVNEKSLDRFLLSDLTKRTRVDFNLRTTAGNVINTNDTREMAFSPSGKFIFVTNRNGRLFIVNREQTPLPDPNLELTLGGSESVDYVVLDTASTRGIASDSQFVYIVEGTPPALKILSDKDLPVIKGDPVEILISTLTLGVPEIPLGAEPNEIALDPANHRAYVTLNTASQLSVIDTNLFIEIARISLKENLPAGIASGEEPFAVSVYHSGGVPYIYVLNLKTNNISILNGNTLTLVGSYP